jgi:hypothetical protein
MKHLKADLASIQMWCNVMLLQQWTVVPNVSKDCHAGTVHSSA